MDIISPPASTVFKVIDLDVGFLSGDVREFTIFESDKLEETKQALFIEIWPRDEKLAVVPGQPAEQIVIYKIGLAWTSRRSRTFEFNPDQMDEGRKVEIA
jgi:hypothetical protein